LYRKVVRAIVSNQDIELEEVPYSPDSGATLLASLARWDAAKPAALVIPQPNFFGVLESVDALTDWAHAHDALAIAVVNPVACALLKPPGRWGSKGADIAVGEGQPLGVPLSAGGPYFGFMGCKQAYVRQMPGRIVGRTSDVDGGTGFTLTLQAREQHIRRSKATSNICTNQGLAVTAATIHMAILGPRGLRQVAARCHANLNALLKRLSGIAGATRAFASPVFHECVIKLPAPAVAVLKRLEERRIIGGLGMVSDYPELGDAMLVCATETKTDADLDQYANGLREILRQ
jgi:glycine dehydrogenase subunit 1